MSLGILENKIGYRLRQLKNAICAPSGFKAGAVACGLKKSGRLDLGLIYSEVPAVACGVFTINKFAAAPVVLCKQNLRYGQAQAVIANSGNANCFTGKNGLETAGRVARHIAGLLKIRNRLVLTASTGIIGKELDFRKIKNALPSLVKDTNRSKGYKFAQAIMTTDTRPKELVARFTIGGKTVTIGGVAKGAGMIAPNMATMLCFITSDGLIQRSALRRALQEAVDTSFNMLSVDGCMSTNDSVIVLANGLAGNKMITLGSRDFAKFSSMLKTICLGLAKMIIQDAEGATKFITVTVTGARNYSEAKKAASEIANSNLFKTAIYGENPNFGRIVAAVGASGVKAADDIRIVCSSLKGRDVNLRVDLMVGKASATMYTCDLSPDYIRINAEYN